MYMWNGIVVICIAEQRALLLPYNVNLFITRHWVKFSAGVHAYNSCNVKGPHASGSFRQRYERRRVTLNWHSLLWKNTCKGKCLERLGCCWDGRLCKLDPKRDGKVPASHRQTGMGGWVPDHEWAIRKWDGQEEVCYPGSRKEGSEVNRTVVESLGRTRNL